MKKGNALNK